MKKIKKSLSVALATLLMLTVIPLGIAFGVEHTVTAEDIPDANLLEALTELAGVDGSLNTAQLAAYSGDLDLKNKNISDITGLRLAKNAVSVDLSGNPLTEVPAQGFSNMPGLTSVVLPDTVTAIGEMAFYKTFSLDNFVMPNSVTSIGDACFLNVEMTNITLSEKLTAIPDMAFMNCVNLKELIIPESVTAFGIDSFAYCAALENVNIPSGIEEIPESCFEGCSSLGYVELPQALKAIGKDAFYKCTELLGAFVPDDVLTIGDGAFMNCEKMVGVSVGSNTSVGANAFKNAPLLTAPDVRAVPAEISLEAGEAYTFTQKPLSNVQWASSDTAVLDIDSNGSAVAKKAGTVEVKCGGFLNGFTNADASKAIITFNVTVAQPEPTEKIVIMKKEQIVAYVDGQVLPMTDYGNGNYAMAKSVNGTYALPLRCIGEAFDMKVDYLGSGKTKLTNALGEYVVVTRDSTLLEKYDVSDNLVNSFTADFATFTDEAGITYVPMRAVSEALGLGVSYVGSGTTGHGSYVAVSTDLFLNLKPEFVLEEIEKAYALGL